MNDAVGNTIGALWCPIGESSAIDIVSWGSAHVMAALKPKETKIGELLQRPGDKILYTYDLGDFWEHEIELEFAFPVEESTGRLQVLAGEMRCPDEDGSGNDHYQEEVLDLLGCVGLEAACEARASTLNLKHGRFDPCEFSVEEAQQSVNEAFRTRASAMSGSKIFQTPMPGFGMGGMGMGGMGYDFSGPGQQVHQTPTSSGAFLSETISSKPDDRDEAICHTCGSPLNLTRCGGCRALW